jgi:hypothetical protein
MWLRKWVFEINYETKRLIPKNDIEEIEQRTKKVKLRGEQF